MSELSDAFTFTGSTNDMVTWCKSQHIPLHEGRQRYSGYAVLACFSTSKLLSQSLAFKGGNALRFVYGNPRSTTDLDFSVCSTDILDSDEFLGGLINDAFRIAHQRFGMKMRCQSIKRNPKTLEHTFQTYQIGVGYQFIGDRGYADFGKAPSNTSISIEISFNDKVCDTIQFRPLKSSPSTITVCSLMDIVAEKLRSLLQQPIRNRNRHQDVFDLARIFRVHRNELDLEKVYFYFSLKCQARSIVPTRRAFDETIRELAFAHYDRRIKEQAGDQYIPFQDAWTSVLELVNLLPEKDSES